MKLLFCIHLFWTLDLVTCLCHCNPYEHCWTLQHPFFFIPLFYSAVSMEIKGRAALETSETVQLQSRWLTDLSQATNHRVCFISKQRPHNNIIFFSSVLLYSGKTLRAWLRLIAYLCSRLYAISITVSIKKSRMDQQVVDSSLYKASTNKRPLFQKQCILLDSLTSSAINIQIY